MSSPQENLQNLQKIGQLKPEPPDQAEFDRLVRSARRNLPDAENLTVSSENRFRIAYDAPIPLPWPPFAGMGTVRTTAISFSKFWAIPYPFPQPSGGSLTTVT